MRRCKYHFCPDCVIREDLFPAKDVVGCDVERDTIEITTRAAQELFKLVDKAQARAFHAKLELEEVKAELEAARRWAWAWKQAAKLANGRVRLVFKAKLRDLKKEDE